MYDKGFESMETVGLLALKVLEWCLNSPLKKLYKQELYLWQFTLETSLFYFEIMLTV